MNDRDRQQFQFWIDHYPSDRLDNWGLYELMKDSWKTACEYMQAELAHHIFKIEAENTKLKECSNLMDAMTRTSQNNAKLQAENAKLRECVEFYADNRNYNCCEAWNVYWYVEDEQDEVGKRARQCLKELEDK